GSAPVSSWPGGRPAHALDIHVMLLRPKRGYDVIGRIAAGSVAAGDGAMLLGMPPVLKPHRSVRCGKARAVAGREDRRIAGASPTVDNDAVLHVEARLLRESIVGRDPGPDDDKISRNRATALDVEREPSVRQLAQS